MPLIMILSLSETVQTPKDVTAYFKFGKTMNFFKFSAKSMLNLTECAKSGEWIWISLHIAQENLAFSTHVPQANVCFQP